MRKVRWLLWGAVVALAVAVFAADRLNASEWNSVRGELGKVPAFSLTNQLGQSVTDQSLRGAPWVANFIFTRCGSVCPMLTAKFKAFQTRLHDLDEVRYVSITVDPEYDRPAVLARYAERFQADPARWQFLTGSLDAIEKTVVEGFKIHIGEVEESEVDPNLIDIMHGEHFVLVDRTGVIRGYFRADKSGLSELERELRALVLK